jgi:hypothetical protein
MKFINDLIHLTKGEFFIKYWYLYLTLMIVCIILIELNYRKKKKEINDKYDRLERKNK